jgi:hypothetical protein
MDKPPNTQSDFQEILARLEAMRLSVLGEKAPVIPLIDPTANVLSLVAAAIARQDDLRLAEFRRVDELRIKAEECQHEVEAVRSQALKDLANAESKRIDALTLAESRRLDALLAAASNNVALASEKAGAQAATLAASVASSAEALRNQVAATSQATNALITQVRESLEKRLQIVEQNQFAAGGANLQRSEGTMRNQWTIGIIIGICLGLAQLLSHFWK